MYTRNFFPDAEGISIPLNYDGNAFTEEPKDTPPPSTIVRAAPLETKISRGGDLPSFDIESEDEEVPTFKEERSFNEDTQSVRTGLFPKLPFGKLFDSKLPSFLGFDSIKLGSEEILIIAVAAFLFFTKGADKECAIILLLLLLVN